MEAIKRYISGNWIWITAGMILTVISVRVAYIQRGYMAYGGEWLVLPLILMAVDIAKNIRDTMIFLLDMKEDK